MASEWGTVELGTVATVVMGQSPPGSTYNETGDGLPFFQGVKDFGDRHPSVRVYCSAPSRVAKPGDILFSVRAPIGRVNVAVDTCAIGRGLAVIRPNDAADARYIELTLRHIEEAWSALEGGGSVFGNATRRDLESLAIPWPTEPAQRHAIAHILGTLDDKIELNRRTARTLEEMARALFKAWFVDFEPVRAKMEGRWRRGESLPGLPAHLYDLFPDRLVDSECGEIPEGWEVEPLDQIATFLNGLALQKYPPTGDGRFLPVIKIAQLRAGNTEGADRASADLKLAYVVHDGDILFSWSGSLECVYWAGGPGALNQHLFKVTPNGYPKWLCYLAIHLHLDEFRHIAAGKATTMGHIQRHHLSDAKLAVPPAELVGVLDTVFGALLEETWHLNVASRTCARLRDTLLPKLVSGEIRLPAPERVLAEVE